MSRLTSNLLRVLSIIAVVIIHATSDAEHAFIRTHAVISDDFLGVLLNQLARFSVPVFVALSGFGLTMKYAGSGSGEKLDSSALMDFFRGRAVKILLPFVFWTVVFFFLLERYTWNAKLDTWSNLMLGGGRLLTFFTTEGVDYHFYFFIIIIQCYFVFPFLFRFRRRWLWGVFLIVHLAFTSPAHYLFTMAGIRRPGFFSAFILYWMFWFYTGIMLAAERERIIAVLKRIKGWLMTGVPVLAAGIVVGEYLYKTGTQSNPDWFNHFARWSVTGYGLAVLAFFVRFDRVLSDRLERVPARAAAVNMLAGLSFTVYILHVWPLRWLDRLTGKFEIAGFVLLLLITVFGGALLLSRLIRRPKWVRTVLGM